MANRRMFSLDVVDTDKFLDMPASSQNLYFHLGMRADDDGFVSSPNKITKLVNCAQDDLNVLISRGYIIPFDSGIIVINHWKQNNYIQSDRYNKTVYQQEMNMLTTNNNVYELDTKSIQPVYEMEAQVRLGKDSIGKDSIGKDRDRIDYQQIADMYNNTCVSFPRLTKLSDSRKKAIKVRMKTYTLKDFDNLFQMAEASSFLKGQNNRNWTASFDWLIKDTNMAKVLDGNYVNRDKQEDEIKHYEYEEPEYLKKWNPGELTQEEKELLGVTD